MTTKIIIVEDDDCLVNIYKNILPDKSYKLIFVTQGNEVIKIASKEKADLILLDTIMPNKSGEKVLEELAINKNTKDVPVIILSNKDKNLLKPLGKFPNVKEIHVKIELNISALKKKLVEFARKK